MRKQGCRTRPTRVLVVLFCLVASTTMAAGPRPEPPVSTDPGGPGRETATSAGTVDRSTAEALTAAGVMPFRERVPASEFSLRDLTGAVRGIGDWAGQVVFLNFWATWCPPCREEMPAMQALHDELAPEGFVVVAVNVLESADVVRSFVDEHGYTYPVLLDTDGRVMLRYGVRAYPTTYVLDRSGRVVGMRPGYHDWSRDEVIAGFRSLLAEPSDTE